MPAVEDLGLPVFPVKPKGKAPLTPRGFKDASADPHQVLRWKAEFPDCNWGLPTGVVSGLVVIDVDPRAGGSESLKSLEAEFGPFPDTWFVETGGGGFHFYFKHPGGTVPCSSGKVAPGIDIKGDGGYVVIPPSIHPSGRAYGWDGGQQPGGGTLAPLPPWVLDRIMAHKPARQLAEGQTIPEGEREATLCSMAGALRRKGAAENEILAALKEVNRRCTPPIQDKDLERISKSISRYTPEQAPGNGPKPLIIHTADELGTMDIPPRDYILDPWLRAKDLAMIYAKRGIGKTWVSNGIALAVATGTTFLGWTAPKIRNVLLIDGEMQAESIKERLQILADCAGTPLPPALRILANDLQEVGGIPNIASAEGQLRIESVMGDSEVLIFDNLSTLCRGGVENEAESWDAMQAWLVDLRRRGLCAILVHHAGHSGNQRGTTKREDILDSSISLEHPEDYTPDQGAHFLLKFTKARALHGTQAETIDARLQTDMYGAYTWTFKPLAVSEQELVLQLSKDGLSIREIVAETNIKKTKVHRLLRLSRENGDH